MIYPTKLRKHCLTLKTPTLKSDLTNVSLLGWNFKVLPNWLHLFLILVWGFHLLKVYLWWNICSPLLKVDKKKQQMFQIIFSLKRIFTFEALPTACTWRLSLYKFPLVSKAMSCHYHEHFQNSLCREYKLKHFCSLTFWTLWQISIVSFCSDNRQFQLPHFVEIAKHFNCIILQTLNTNWIVSLCRDFKRFWLSHFEEIIKRFQFQISFWRYYVYLLRFQMSHFAEITKDINCLTLLWAE